VPVDVFTVSHPDDQDADAARMDFIEDAVVADTEPIRVLTASELPNARRKRVLCE
jgi:hypothetical protein